MFGMKTGKPAMFRQGDVLIRQVSALPDGRKQEYKRDKDGRIVLAYGEVTGHAHAIHSPGVEAWLFGGNKLFLDVKEEGAKVQHEEHALIPLDPGKYEVIRQREWTQSDEIRYVAD